MFSPGPWFYTWLPSLPCLAWLPQAPRDPSARPLTQAGSLFSPRMPGMLAQPLGQAGHGGNLSGSGVHLLSVPGQLDTAPPLSGQRISIPLPRGPDEAPERQEIQLPVGATLYSAQSLDNGTMCPSQGHRRLRVPVFAGVSLNEARVAADFTAHPANYARAMWLSGPIQKHLTLPLPPEESRVVISSLCPLAVN